MELELEVSIDRLSVTAIMDVVYSQQFNWRNQKLKMNIFKPKTSQPVPAVLFISGGGFITVNKAHCLQVQLHLAESGYLVAGVEYSIVGEGLMEDALADLKTAVRFLKANAKKLNLDSDNIGAVGESAGGYLAAMLGVTNNCKQFDRGDYLDYSSEVRAVVDFYGYTNFNDEELKKISNSANLLFLNGIPPFYGISENMNENKSRLAMSNPITYISKNTPPFLFFHGEDDKIVPPNQTKILHDALKECGIMSRRVIIKNAGHAGEVWRQPAIEEMMVDFLNKCLK